MKIRTSLIIFFSLVITLSVGITAFFTTSYVESGVIDAELLDMKLTNKQVMNDIETLHARASEDLVFALKNPKFVEYFELPESKQGNVYDESGVLQFTENQKEIKNELEQWIFHFQNKFDVDETCIIDTSGQEHARLVLSKIEIDENLSPDEVSAPFFEPSFMTQKDQVHVQYPYVSPDTERWVFAYTSPVELGNGQKPAIYHFEMPMTIFQDMVKVSEGRMYVIDPSGYIVADSQGSVPKNMIGYLPEEQFPLFQTAHASETPYVLEDMLTNDMGDGKYLLDGKDHYFVYEKLSTFDWILVYEKPYSAMIVGNSNISDLNNALILISAAIVGLGVIGTIFISSRISRPLQKLVQSIEHTSKGNYTKIPERKSNEEIEKITVQFNDMQQKIKYSQDHLNNRISQRTAELEKSNQTITKQLEEIKKTGIEKDEFSNMVSHELKTPLTPIKFNTEMLMEPGALGNLNESQLESVREIESNAARLENLISELLHAQKLNSKEMTYNKTKFKPKNLIERVTENLSPLIQEKNIKLEIKSHYDGDVFSDEEKILKVLEHLIKNSIRYVSDYGEISIDIKSSPEFVTFYVKDDGIGIPKNKQQHMFKKFYQIDTSHTRKYEGAGLGLVICKGFVEGLGGKIWFESDEGKGTTFYFSIPLNKQVGTVAS